MSIPARDDQPIPANEVSPGVYYTEKNGTRFLIISEQILMQFGDIEEEMYIIDQMEAYGFNLERNFHIDQGVNIFGICIRQPIYDKKEIGT